MSTNTHKLRVLRARTDQDLLVIVRRELDRGFTQVGAARSRNSPLLAQAEKALATANVLLPQISDLSNGDRLPFETRMEELKVKLARVPLYANLPGYSASFVP